MRILLLGGTAEARELAGRLPGQEVTYALAGATEAPLATGVAMRIGGFGGAEGLAQYLRAEGVERLVDGTHPFAATMKANAGVAATQAGVPLVHLIRPGWGDLAAPHERVAGLAAAAALAAGENVFLALGARHLQAFFERDDVRFVARAIDPQPSRDGFTFLAGRPPFSVEAEAATFRTHGITALVLRDSGGAEGLSKLVAARQTGLRIVMVDRPEPPPGRVAATVEEVLDWLGREQA